MFTETRIRVRKLRKFRRSKVVRGLVVGVTLLTLNFALSACPELDALSGSSDSSDSGASGDAASSDAGEVLVGDYGDAPDDRDNTSASPRALFPTRAASRGAHHLDTTQSALGYFLSDGSLPVSAEWDATDPADPDGMPNLDDTLGPDQDAYDDGLLIGLLPAGGRYEFPVVVSVASAATDQRRYVNILADWNKDLEWKDTDADLPEWVVKNYPVEVAPGTTERVFVPEARIGGETHGVWIRVTLSETPVDEAAFPDGWDGTGEFAEGETEDYIFDTLPLNEPVFDEILYHPDLPEDEPGTPNNPAGPEGGTDNGNPDDLGDGDDDEEQCEPADEEDADADPNDFDGDGDVDGDDDVDGDGTPGLDKKNIGKLRKVGPNSYRLVLCKGKRWQRGFEWETLVRNGASSNPFVAGVGVSSDPGTVTIQAREVGTSTVSFEANVVTFPSETVEWVTGTIIVTVIDCDPPCANDAAGEDGGDADGGADDAAEADDHVGVNPDPNGAFAGVNRVNYDDINKLRHGEGNTYYLVLCICEENYERGFEYMTRVRSAQSSNPAVADLGLQNDPGRIRITPYGLGETTVTFEADPATFPYDVQEWSTITIHVLVIECPEEYFYAMYGF